MTFDPARFAVFLLGFVAGAGVFVFKLTLVGNSPDLAELVVTIFSVMAGFLLVAVNQIVANADGVKFRRVRAQIEHERLIDIRALRYSYLFYLYLVILTSVFVSKLTGKPFPGVSDFFERLYLGVAMCALIWSFFIPGLLLKLKQEKRALDRHKGQ